MPPSAGMARRATNSSSTITGIPHRLVQQQNGWAGHPRAGDAENLPSRCAKIFASDRSPVVIDQCLAEPAGRKQPGAEMQTASVKLAENDFCSS